MFLFSVKDELITLKYWQIQIHVNKRSVPLCDSNPVQGTLKQVNISTLLRLSTKECHVRRFHPHTLSPSLFCANWLLTST